MGCPAKSCAIKGKKWSLPFNHSKEKLSTKSKTTLLKAYSKGTPRQHAGFYDRCPGTESTLKKRHMECKQFWGRMLWILFTFKLSARGTAGLSLSLLSRFTEPLSVIESETAKYGWIKHGWINLVLPAGKKYWASSFPAESLHSVFLKKKIL